jgi:hypothetical protein
MAKTDKNNTSFIYNTSIKDNKKEILYKRLLAIYKNKEGE